MAKPILLKCWSKPGLTCEIEFPRKMCSWGPLYNFKMEYADRQKRRSISWVAGTGLSIKIYGCMLNRFSYTNLMEFHWNFIYVNELVNIFIYSCSDKLYPICHHLEIGQFLLPMMVGKRIKSGTLSLLSKL